MFFEENNEFVYTIISNLVRVRVEKRKTKACIKYLVWTWSEDRSTARRPTLVEKKFAEIESKFFTLDGEKNQAIFVLIL